jgi:hypothetical protein
MKSHARHGGVHAYKRRLQLGSGNVKRGKGYRLNMVEVDKQLRFKGNESGIRTGNAEVLAGCVAPVVVTRQSRDWRLAYRRPGRRPEVSG